MTFDMYGWRADEARPYAKENKSNNLAAWPQIFLNTPYNGSFENGLSIICICFMISRN